MCRRSNVKSKLLPSQLYRQTSSRRLKTMHFDCVEPMKVQSDEYPQDSGILTTSQDHHYTAR